MFSDGQKQWIKILRLSSSFEKHKKGYKIAPRGIAFTPNGKWALVLASETGSLLIIDSVHHQQIAEVAPIDDKLFNRALNLRHIVMTKDGKIAYLSHMRGNSVSRINVEKLIELVERSQASHQKVLPASTWDEILIPFSNGKKLLVLEEYPSDHPNFANRTWPLAHPNTIVLDPVENRYLYVSHRTTSNKNYEIFDPKIKGKIDIIDTSIGKVIFSLVGGAQPTALEVSPDNKTLMSAGFKDDQLYFFDLDKILSIYRQ